MNQVKLQGAEEVFLRRYPGGFANPELASIRTRKHNVDRMIACTQECFARIKFKLPEQIVQDMAKIISRSSVISVFEKTRFREFSGTLFPAEEKLLSHALQELLHGQEQRGFEAMLGMLKSRKLAKWSLMTICQTYFHPQRDVLVKPTTVKGIIQYFELKHLQYRPTPSWEFYETYRDTIHEMKSKVDPSLSPTNAAFSWFLLLSFRHHVS